MQFSKNFPDQLRSQINTSDVVAKKVSLKKKGKEYSGLCPFHNEKSPSFTVNDEKGFYHCFGCGAHGDIIGFTMQTEGLGFKDAIVKLAVNYNIQIPLIVSEYQDHKEQEKLERDFLLLEKTCQFFENNLLSNAGNYALQYLHQRGLNNQQIKKFRLGFAHNNYESLINYLKSTGFSDTELLASGVIAKNDQGKLYDKFRNRIIFPITNNKGQIIAFGGRILGDGQPKYLNSSETELFKKGHNLYNLSNAKKEIYEQNFAVVVEGYMDVISLSINGIENVVAPLGTAITTDQLEILFKTTSDVVICLDGDAAGIKAMRRSIDLSLPIVNHKNLVRFAILPNGVDPDDFVKNNGKIITQNFLKNAANLSQVLFDFEADDLGINNQEFNKITPEKKSRLEAKLFQKINLISDANYKKYFLQYYKNMLFGLGKNKFSQPQNINHKIKFNNALQLDKQSNYSIAIISILINFPELVNYQDDMCVLRNLEFKNQELSNIKEGIIYFIDHNSDVDFIKIKSHLEKIIADEGLKNKILGNKLFDRNLSNATIKLKIFLLKYFYEEVGLQYIETLASSDIIETNEATIKNGKQKELFDYKTFLEKKILQLESDLM